MAARGPRGLKTWGSSSSLVGPRPNAAGSGGSRLAYKEGSHFAKLDSPAARPVFIQKTELEALRNALSDLAG